MLIMKKSSTLTLWALLLLGSASEGCDVSAEKAFAAPSEPKVTETDVIYQASMNPGGNVGIQEYCPKGSWVSGLKFKRSATTADDKAGLTGIELSCSDAEKSLLTSSVSKLGNWDSNAIDSCPGGYDAAAFLYSTKKEGATEFDNEGLNGVSLRCRHTKKWSSVNAVASCSVLKTEKCKEGTSICGLRTRVHRSIGNTGDDLGIIDAQLTCCKPAKVDGGYSSWGTWGACDKPCAKGTKVAKRTCTNPSPSATGAQCVGEATKSAECNTHECPINGGWSAWGSYGTCTKTCGYGMMTRTRTCTNPAPKFDGNPCLGDASEDASCFLKHCPVNGNWGAWGSWSSCSKTCDGGTVTRSRPCNNPSWAYGGAPCPGSSSESAGCNVRPCHCPFKNKDIWGYDVTWWATKSPKTCQEWCLGNSKCKGWTWVGPAYIFTGNRCYYKSISYYSSATYYKGGMTSGPKICKAN